MRENQKIRNLLRSEGITGTDAAKLLHVSRRTFYRRLNKAMSAEAQEEMLAQIMKGCELENDFTDKNS